VEALVKIRFPVPRILQCLCRAVAVAGGDKFNPQPAQLVLGVEQLEKFGVPRRGKDDAAVRVQNADAVGRGVDERAVKFLRFALRGLGLLARGDVAHDGLDDRLAAQFQPVQADFGIEQRAIAARMNPLEELRGASQRGLDIFGGFFGGKSPVRLALRGKIARRFADDFFARTTIHDLRHGVAVEKHPVVHDQDRVVGRVEQRLELLLAFAQRGDGPVPRGDIPKTPDAPDDAAFDGL